MKFRFSESVSATESVRLLPLNCEGSLESAKNGQKSLDSGLNDQYHLFITHNAFIVHTSSSLSCSLNSPKDFLPIIAGILSEPEATAEARQPAQKPKSDRVMKTLNDDKSEGVKFYELDDEEEILPNGNEPVPQVTMPTFKKRVHSQRIPQSERAAVTPYEGAYDERYSSDEENVEYEVCEPEDLTERSNSTITFSEDVYDSDAIDEMLRNQVRKPSQVSQGSSVRSEDATDGSKPSRGILKGKSGKKGDCVGQGPATADEKSEMKDADKIVSPGEKAAVAGDAKIPEPAPSGKDKKSEKGEEILEDVTKTLQSVITDSVTGKESSMKGEREHITKPPQSTIPQQIDQITDSSATNNYDFAKSDEKVVVNVTKPLQDALSTGSAVSSTLTSDPTAKMADEKPPAVELPPSLKTETEDTVSDKAPGDMNRGLQMFKISSGLSADSKDGGKISKISEMKKENGISVLAKEEISPAREDAARRARELIDDITKAVEDVFPGIAASKDGLPNAESAKLKDRESEAPKAGAEDGEAGNKPLQTKQIPASKPEKVREVEGPSKKSTEPTGKGLGTELTLKADDMSNQHVQGMTATGAEMAKELFPEAGKVASGAAEFITGVSPSGGKVEMREQPTTTAEDARESDNPQVVADIIPPSAENIQSVLVDLKGSETVDVLTSDAKTGTYRTDSKETDPNKIFSHVSSDSVKTTEVKPVDQVGELEKGQEVLMEKDSKSEREVTGGTEPTGDGSSDPESKPRVIFRIDSEDELLSDAENEPIPPPSVPSSPAGELTEKAKQELKEALEKDKMKLEERLSTLKGSIFDISDESLSKTKEIVDERLRKISEIRPPQEVEEAAKKEKSPGPNKEVKIGRFHITPALVEEVVSRSKEQEIAERLKTTRAGDDSHEEMEKELPEKLTEADLEEVIRELKKEGLKTDVYLQPEEAEKEEKKERTLKRVERRFERMASETLEKEKEEEGISEEKLIEKREIEFQRMVSNLSSDEVAEYQKEYLQLWEEGGLTSLTPTEDWESRDPDTPENELEDDSPRKSESFQGWRGTGKPGTPNKSSESKKSPKSPKSPTSPPKPSKPSDDASPKAQPLTPLDPSHVGSSPSEVDHSSGFVSERSDDIPTYSERKKFWEQMSSSQSSENAGELQRSMIESISSAESVDVEELDRTSGRTIRQPEPGKTPEDGSTVKSLRETYSRKIAAGELIMPAVPRPKSSVSIQSIEAEQREMHKIPDSSDTAVVSELEVKLKSRDSGAPITEAAVVSGSTGLEEHSGTREVTAEEEAEFTAEGTAPSLKEREKALEDFTFPVKSKQERSMSLPAAEVPDSVKMKKKYFEQETITEQVLSQAELPKKAPETQIEDAAVIELLSKGVKIVEKKLLRKEQDVKTATPKETHLEKSETEGSEKEKTGGKKEEEPVPSIVVTPSGKRQPETASIGESEDTQSESDVTPEEARVVDSGDTQWEGSGTHSESFSPKDDMDYPKEMAERGIGRWLGQEDLSKQSWEKDDLDSSHFKARTKWERTHSEGGSPKDRYVCTPEEHYPDTVWEVPVQEQLEKEEITHDIPIEKQVIIEKDEDELEEEEVKGKLTEEEAKDIAEEVLEYIQFEVENRSSFLTNDTDEAPENLTQAQVSDYLRHLTKGKDFDDQDVKLIENILVKKQREQLWKSQSVETTACSVDITDEELRSTGGDEDISPVESQITKLQNLERGDFSDVTSEISEKDDGAIREGDDSAQRLKDEEIVDKTLAEVKESLEAAQEQLIEQHKRKAKSEIAKKESPSEFELKGMSSDRKIPEMITEQPSDWEKEKKEDEKKTSRESLKEQILIRKSKEEESIYSESEKEKLSHKSSKDSWEEEKQLSHQIQTTTETARVFESDHKTVEKTDFDKSVKTVKEISKEVEVEGKKTEQTDLHVEDKDVQQIKAKEISEKETIIHKNGHRVQTSTAEEAVTDSLQESEKSETTTTGDTTVKVSSRLTETSKIHKAVVSESKMDVEELKTLEITLPETMVVRKMGDQIGSSEDSPRSASWEDARSPPAGEEILSSGSSADKHGENILFRHSSSLSVLKADRRSGADLEPYSSSGESHYHSFEQPPSRPCSSDVEALLAGNVGTTGSSEYESAMSQEASSKHQTSTDYQTAVSSLSSRESMRSLDSESSGHLGSVEVSSEASETLIPSALELDRDVEAGGAILADDEQRGGRPGPSVMSGRSADEDFEIISELEVASLGEGGSENEEGVPEGEEAKEHAQKMKRSYEMTFQPEPKPVAFFDSMDGLPKDVYMEKGPDESEKFGSSLEESGSVLSMSLSTTSEPSAMRTVIELSHTDSEKMEGSLTVSATSTDSREDLDNMSSQALGLTNEMSTSTVVSGSGRPAASVTMTTSSSDVHGVPCVSTQVTSVSRKSSTADEVKSEGDSREEDSKYANGPTQVEYVPDYDEVDTTKPKRSQGHRRKESTSSFVWNLSEARTLKVRTDITEMDEEHGSDKYVCDLSLTEKEVKNDEKKEADDAEGHEQGLEEHERKPSEGEVEEFKDYDNSRPRSQISRTDSDSERRYQSPAFSEDQPDSELSELMKQGSSEAEREDPLERPLSPEPEEMENKDITPELSSEAQASVTELEMEYSGAYSRRDEYASHVSPIREEKSDTGLREPPTEEYPEEDRIPDGLRSQTSLESAVAEKHELETGEKEILQKKPDLPDITVTEHLTPVSARKFQYPDSKDDAKEKKSLSKTQETPASTSSRTADEIESRKMAGEAASEEKGVSETKDEKESLDSPNSDSFEMLDKPDITDEFVIIEEVGREAQENDKEGKSIKIATRDKKPPKRVKEEQEVIISPSSPATKMTELKYYPSEEDPDLFLLDSDSPPQAATRKFAEKLKKPIREEKYEEYEQQIEQSKKWVEMQFQGEQAAKIMGAYGYEMEFERAPLEDIKEEELNELDSSSKMGSIGSQKESLGSFGSVKDSFSSTPDFDVLAGRKYFSRSGEHDDVSMSSLQEFELIEKKLMENGKKSGSSSSQDSLSSKKLGTSSKSGQGDDVSTGSLKEFETLESACATEFSMEKKAKQEEAILSEIDEGHESQISESESCETVSAVVREKLEFDSEDFDKKMFEIDEIIKQAQSNVEKFSEMQALEKIESIGRGDSYEEVAKVPDLELDMPLSGKSTTEASNPKPGKGGASYLTQHVIRKKADEWRTAEETGQRKAGLASAKHSELLENGGKIKSISADSLEIQTQERKIILEGNEETVSLDSYKSKSQKGDPRGFSEMTHKSDSMEEVRHHDSSSGEYTSSGTDHRPPPRAEFVLGSTDSLDPSSSTATHATYQYETDSVMSCSFTSGDSNTMISSTDNLDLLVSGQSVIDLSKDLAISKTDDWLEKLKTGGGSPMQKQPGKPRLRSEVQKVEFRGPDAEKAFQEYVQGLGPQEEVIEEEVDEHGDVHIKKVLKQRVVIRTVDPKQGTTVQHEKVGVVSSQPFVSETVQPLEDDTYSHVVRKKVQMAPEVEKITFRGPGAEEALKSYFENLPGGEEVDETEEIDEHGNIIRKKIIRQRVVIRPGEEPRPLQLGQKRREEDPEKALHADSDKSKESAEDGSLIIKKVLPEKKSSPQEDKDAMEIIDIGPGLQKIIVKGPNAEKVLEDYAQSLNPEDDVLEIEETDEDGNVHLKKVLRQRILVRPNKELTGEELQQYLSQLVESESLEGEGYSHVVQKTIDVPAQIEKVTFKGPDAEKQLQEYIRLQQQQQPEVEEIEEVDELGNTHIKRIIRERVVVKPSRELTKAELEEYLNSLEEPEWKEKSPRVTQTGIKDSTEVQKVTFEGPDAEEQLQEYIRLQQQQQPEVEEIEEVDEHGNVHVKRIMRERVVVRPNRELTKEELEEYLNRLEEPEWKEESPRVTQTGIKDSTEVQKIIFKGPDAEKQLQEYIRLQQQQQPEVEEIEEVDEHGNVHVKRIIKQKIIIRPGQSAEGFSDSAAKQSRMLTKAELEQHLDQLEEPKSGGDVKDGASAELSERLLTEEEFQERLRLRETTFHTEDIYVGSREPFVSEIIEPLDEEGYSHVIHRKVEMAPEVQKVVFRGPDADRAMKAYVEALKPGEDIEEVEEVDDRGNVHVKRILTRKILVRPEDLEKTGLKGEELGSYLKRFELERFEGGEGPRVHPIDPILSSAPRLTQGFSSSVVLTEKEGHSEEEKAKSPPTVGRKETGISQRPPLVSDISMDDEAEYDPTEHDWRHQLEILHAEADEDEIDQNLDAALAAPYSSRKEP